jgi:LysM repeat protein
MNKLLILLLFFIGTAENSLAQNSLVIKNYVAQYKDIAMQEMMRTGVPASITLAQGILETEAGQSKLVRTSNNHFGIKCKSDWTGDKVYHDDDAKGECFRKYDDPTQSYKDHSDFLKNRAHYASLFNLDPSDYEAWAYGLKKAGYATNPKYPQLLIKLIRDYNLQDYTLIALGKKVDVPADGTPVIASDRIAIHADAEDRSAKDYPSGVFRINDTKVIRITRGTSYFVIADKHNISLSKLFEFNDMIPQEEAGKDHLLYLQRKKKTGAAEEHVVQRGETLWDIAQSEGIRMESLLTFNYLRTDVDPTPGRKLYLQGADKKAAIPDQRDRKEDVLQAANRYNVHTVGSKETLYAISKKYGVTVEDIMQWNGLESTSLKQGQQLRINK